MSRLLIVGGGIGGLAAGLAVRLAGFEAVVFEQASELREAGAGVALWSNAMLRAAAHDCDGEPSGQGPGRR